jgi:uncharacterized membrane protein
MLKRSSLQAASLFSPKSEGQLCSRAACDMPPTGSSHTIPSFEDQIAGIPAGCNTTTGASAMAAETPILPAHIEETIRAIAKLHADHREEAGTLQRVVERLTAWIGRPRFIAAMTMIIALWIGDNLIALFSGSKPWDAPPFNWLQGGLGLLALYVTVLILTTQRRDDQLASHREQLTLELAILGEQKSAKIISLLEELRRDHPHLENRVDDQAAAMAVAADPQAVLDAIKESAETPPASGEIDLAVA